MTPNHPLRTVRAVLLLVLLLAACPSTAIAQADADVPQETAAAADPRFASPEDTMFTFLDAMGRYERTKARSALDDAKRCCDLAPVPNAAKQDELAAELFGILNRIGEVHRWHFSRPDGATYLYFPDRTLEDHARLENRFPDFRIELVRTADGRWLFSAETMQAVDDRFRDWEPLPILVGGGDVQVTIGQWIRSKMPPALRSDTFLTLEYWQWLAILTIVFAGVVLDFAVRTVLTLIWHRIERKRGPPADRQRTDKSILRRAVRPFGLFAAAAFWYAVLGVGGLPTLAVQVLVPAVKIILSFAGVWAAWRVTDLLADYLARKARATHTKFDDLLIPLIERTVKIFIVAIGLIYIADAFRIPILPLLSGLGIGGLAVAFAAKDTIENFFGSVAVILDRPFEVGDWIVVDDTEGTVEQLGFRSTRIRTFYNSVITVPNATLVRATVDNYGRRRYRRFRTLLNLTYDTPPAKIEAFCEGVREIIRLHPYTRKDYFHVWLNQFGPHSLDVLVYMFFQCPDWAVELRERHRFMLDIMRLADRLGVDFAFPTQTLHVLNEQPDGADIREPPAPPPASAEADAQRTGAEAARALTANQPWRTGSARPGPVTFASPPSQPRTHEYRGDSDDG